MNTNTEITEQNHPEECSHFRPSRARLDEIISEGNKLVANASTDDLKCFSE